jgi:hypothetical protein
MAQLEQVDIRTAPTNLNREDVMQQIVDISRIPLPFMDAIGRSSHSNTKFEWSADRLADPDTTNAVIDGSTAPTPASAPAVRLGNYGQIAQKTVGTSTRVESSNNVGNEGLARQIQKATQELQRDMEAILLSNQANRADTGTGGVAGLTAGLEAWVDDSTIQQTPVTKSPQCFIDLSTGGISIGGWTNRTGEIIPAVDYSSVSAVNALTFEAVKDVFDALYQLGGDPTVMMARPAVIRKFSEFMFGSTAPVSTLYRNKNEDGPASAQAAVNVLHSDYGITVKMVPNRLMQLSGDGSPDSDTLFIMDPTYLAVSFQGGGIRSKELPVSGLARAVQIHADFGLVVKSPDTVGAVFGIDSSAAVTAT